MYFKYAVDEWFSRNPFFVSRCQKRRFRDWNKYHEMLAKSLFVVFDYRHQSGMGRKEIGMYIEGRIIVARLSDDYSNSIEGGAERSK